MTNLETYKDLESSILRKTKVHKLVKAMMRLSSIPMDEEFQFKQRSMDLLNQWTKTLNADPAPADDEKADEKPEAAKEVDGSGEKEEVDADVAENKIGTTVEGEKEAEEDAKASEPATEEIKTDVPDIENNPAGEYKPLVEDAAEDVEA